MSGRTSEARIHAILGLACSIGPWTTRTFGQYRVRSDGSGPVQGHAVVTAGYHGVGSTLAPKDAHQGRSASTP